MAGIYIHIPFCKKKCHYCDFYKSLDTGLTGGFIDSIKKEVKLQKDYLGDKNIETIYLGGGTPTVLTAIQLREIMETLYMHFSISEHPEITIEANPDDISRLYIKDISRTGINRISLGIQTWDDNILRILNRRHNSRQAEEAIITIQDGGIENISVDMIYGIPGMSTKHLSAYHLTIEPGTVFGKMKESGELSEIDEEESEKQFNILMDICRKNNFIQYEISNFCKESYHSRHNTNYWKREFYLGLGPSAHSFNGDTRQWNIADLNAYMKSLEANSIPSTTEVLDLKDLYNEYIMTSLRTMWGIDLDFVEERINKESRDYLVNLATRFIRYGMMIRKENNISLTDQGKMISDNIISELMMT